MDKRFKIGRIDGRYILLEVLLYLDKEDIFQKLFQTSILARKYLIEMKSIIENHPKYEQI
jgi:hypothetical protein